MAKDSAWLLDYEEKIFSQHGEDGVIRKIFDILPDTNKWCVEFGAWDGVHLSNTYNLIKQLRYSAVLIEGDEKRAGDLKEKYKQTPHIHTIHGMVGYGERDNLDIVLTTTPIPVDFDFLSIDIDGNDYYVWESVEQYRPKLVCIEFNHTVPVGVKFVQEKKVNVNQGSSLAALISLAEKKRYKLVCVLRNNAFFIDEKYFDLFDIEDCSEQALRLDLSHVTYIFCGYDGKIFIAGKDKLPWHGISFSNRIKQLPRIFRQHPGTRYGKIQLWLFHFYKDRILNEKE